MEPLNWLLDQYYYNTTTQDYILYVLYPWLVLMITYWSLGGLCLLLDFTRLRASHSVRIRKCQPKRPPTAADVTDIALHVLTHCFTVYPLGILLYFPMTKARVSEDPLDMPDGPEFLLKFFLFALCTEPVFYFIHYVLHHRLFYKRIHSVHHKYQAPIGLEALYFHWIESLLQFSVINVGPYLFGCHLSTLLWWEAAALAIVIIHHSGYEVPGDNLPYVGSLSHFHDYHHKVFNKNFGTVGALDLLFGTCGGWEEHRQAWAEERRVKAKQI